MSISNSFSDSVDRGKYRAQLLRQSGLAALCSLPFLIEPAAAQAQATGATSANQSAQESELADIIVTGSRIRRPNLETAVPVTSVSASELLSSGTVQIGDVLNELPALRSTYSSSNSTRFIGTAGLNFLDLRGLGPDRTLVMVNGRRHVSSSEGTNLIDVDTIPSDLIERVDVVTGGNSAIYGSDAIAGVVNFVLKRDFEGVELRAQGGISSRGDAGTYFLSGTYGKNFGSDNRGNIAIAVEYARQEDLYMADRPTTRSRAGFVAVDTDEPGTPNGSDGVPDRVFVRDVRSLLLSEGGSWIGSNALSGMCPSTLTPQQRALVCLPDGRARIYRFQPDGSIKEADYGKDFRPLANNSDGGDGATLRRYGQLQPQTERFSTNLLMHYDVSDSFKPFIEAKFVRQNVFQEHSPSFDQPVQVSIDNPFLTQETRDFIKARLAPGVTTINMLRNNLDLGSRQENTRRETWRVVAGAEGDISDNWQYEVSANYGQFKRRMYSKGNRVEQRFAFATDAVLDPTGKIVCRVTIDPAARVALSDSLKKYLNDDVAGCVPLNLFGEGASSPEARNYVMTTSRSHGKQTQFVLNGFISGDSSGWLELPGGPIGVAFGGEYRRETAYEEFDELVRNGGTFLNAIPIFDPPAMAVKEAFGEIHVPLLANMRFAHELSLEGAVRVADYKGSTGTVMAYNLGGVYAPIPDIRLRVGYARSVRAPSLSELYSAPTQNFASVTDPCDVLQIGAGSSNRAANCAAAGIPAGFINNPIRSATLEITSSGNPDLTEEKSRSWTIGAVLQPRFMPGFSLSVDYYNIRVTDVIAGVPPQSVLNSCYDSASLDNMFCKLFQRDANHHIIPGSLQDTDVNYAARTARGIDVELNYRTDLGKIGAVGLRMILTRALERNNYPFLDEPDRPDQLLMELGDPRWAWSASLDWQKGPFSATYEVRYIGKQVVNLAEDVYSVGGKPPQNADYAEIMFYPDVFYHDVRLQYDINEKYNLYLGVDNLFDRLAPLGATTTGEGSGIYSNRGRFFYVGATAKF